MNGVEITQLASLPVAGLALFLMYRLVSNHIDHLVESIQDLILTQQDTNASWKEFISWMKGRINNG